MMLERKASSMGTYIQQQVLIEQDMTSLVSSSRPINNDGENPVKKLGKRPRSAVYSPFSFRQIIEFILLLPLNFIPIAGTPVFLILTGYRGGPFHHWRYFKFLGYNKKERKAAIQSRRWKYTWYGTYLNNAMSVLSSHLAVADK